MNKRQQDHTQQSRRVRTPGPRLSASRPRKSHQDNNEPGSIPQLPLPSPPVQRQGKSRPRELSLSLRGNRRSPDDFLHYLQQAIGELNRKKQKLQKCIKLFNLMQNSNAQMRCYEHNNTLTIYCKTEHKSLCANCVYGISKHRTHKLIPLKDASKEITSDNDMLWRNLNLDLAVMDQCIKISQDNSMTLQNQQKVQLNLADQQYARLNQQLKEKFLQKKENIIKTYDLLLDHSKTTETLLEEFKFKVWETLSKIGIGKRSESVVNTDLQISKQMLCNHLSQISKVSIKTITHKQLQKIHQKWKS